MKIKVLDSQLISQIAAGEVVERPSSVVKELLENSLDAGATDLVLEIEGGGIKLISLRDNGGGIAKDDLNLALSRHATSKISSLDDLERIRSFGFRGEALASIASVARFKISSRSAVDEIGWQVISQDGDESALQPTSHPLGTTVEVSDLFFNVPVRRKFLRKEQTEFNHILELVGKIALVRFDVGILFKHNDRIVWSFSPAINQQESLARVGKIVGEEFIQNSYAVDIGSKDLRLSGWISTPDYARNQPDLQYLYVNGRIVKDKTIAHAIKQAYQDLIFGQRYPVVVLYLDIDPAQVDVNVHPAKSEVRFSDSRMIHDFVVKGLKDALALGKNQLIDGVHFTHPKDPVLTQPDMRLNSFCEDKLSSAPSFSSKKSHQDYTQLFAKQQSLPLDVAEELAAYEKLSSFAGQVNQDSPNISLQPDIKNQAEAHLGFALAQLGSSYILAENNDGLIVVDIHAAHERINYERLKAAYLHSAMTSQQLLVPFSLTLSEREINCLEAEQKLLEKMGFDLTRSSQDTILVRAIPALLQNSDVDGLVRDMASDLLSSDKADSLEHTINHVLVTMACHTSIRAGQRLNVDDMNALLRQIEQTDFGDYCGHGRPTWIAFKLKDLEKLFLRS